MTRRRQASWVLGGSCLCCAAHGLSCLVTVRNGARTRTLLFDTGPEDRTFEQTNEQIIPEAVAGLSEFEVAVIAPGHCTGWRATTALANAFGDRALVPLAVGKRFRF